MELSAFATSKHFTWHIVHWLDFLDPGVCVAEMRLYQQQNWQQDAHFTLTHCLLSAERPGARQTHWWADRQGERPWLGKKGGEFPRWSASPSNSWLGTKAWQFLSQVSGSPADGLAHQVRGWIRTCRTTVAGQPTILPVFKTDQP